MSSAAEPRDVASPGLGALDEDRAQSMADEGGASAATWEGEELRTSAGGNEGWILAALAGAVVALLAVEFFRRRR